MKENSVYNKYRYISELSVVDIFFYLVTQMEDNVSHGKEATF